jgi:ABC-2 type transport system ATP-binding protein
MIEVASVTKSFTVRARSGRVRRTRTTVRAVDEVSFSVAPGEFVGYLGPNGAGKSTTIKMLTGILTPSSGSVRVCDLNPSRQRTTLARRIGVVFGHRNPSRSADSPSLRLPSWQANRLLIWSDLR